VINAALGLLIAFLPLFSRFSFVNFERTAKNNLLALSLVAILPFMGPRIRKLPLSLAVAFIYFAMMGILNHHNVVSIYVIIHSFYLLIGLCFFAVYYQAHDEKSLNWVYSGMIAGNLIQCALILSKLAGFDAYPWLVTALTGAKTLYNSSMVMGSLGNSNLVGAYLVLTIPAFLHFKSMGRLLALIPAVCIILTNSQMAIACMIAGLWYLSYGQYKKYLYLAAIIGMALVYFGVEGHDSQRFFIWQQNFNLVGLKHFLVGSGPGWFQDQLIKIKGGAFALEEHNEFLAFFNWFGVIGLALLAKPFIEFISSEDKSRILPMTLFIAFCNAFGHFNLHQSSTLLIILISAAVCLAEGNSNGRNI
jgi:hypothetical protein